MEFLFIIHLTINDDTNFSSVSHAALLECNS